MLANESTIDAQEINKFAQHARYWWDEQGPLKTLHDINPTRVEWILRHTPLAGLKVLDVGCGGGILCEAMALKGAQIVGIDAEADAIQTAQQHAESKSLDIHYLCTPIEEFEQGTFDVITCMEMLEHVNNPELVLAHCKRLLKPGGILLLSTISRTLKAYAQAVIAAEYLLAIVPKQTHEYNKFIKPSELLTIARSLDLSLVDLCGMEYNPFSRTASLCQDVQVNYLLAVRAM